MRWTTTDPRSAGLADKSGATINYVSSGDEFVTLVKVGSGNTDWAEVDAVLPLADGRLAVSVRLGRSAHCRPRRQSRRGRLYYTGGAGVYLIKYGTGNTDWVPLPRNADHRRRQRGRRLHDGRRRCGLAGAVRQADRRPTRSSAAGRTARSTSTVAR
jgi:hypothetical protein